MKKTFYEKYALIILMVMTFLLPIIGVGVKRTLESVRNNIKEWLPDGTPDTDLHRWFQSNFPMEQFVLMSWEDCVLDDPRLDVMKHRLIPERDPQTQKVSTADWNLRYFEKFRSGTDLVDELVEQYDSVPEELQLTREDAIDRLKGSLIGMNKRQTSAMIYLIPGSEGENLRGSIGEIYRLARKPFIFKKSELTEAQKQVCETVLAKQAELPPNTQPEPPNFLEKKLAGLPMPEHLTPAEKEYQAPNANKEDFYVLPGLQPSQLHLGGPPVDNVAIDVEGNRTLIRLAWLAAIVGFVVASLCLRSVRLVLIVFCSALFSTGLATAFVNLTGSEADAIMLSMPPLVYVLTMSSAIHFINYYHDALEEEGGVRGAPERAVKHAFVPVLVSATTTALGLLSLMTSNLGPIYNFGLYSAIGVLVSVLIVLLYIPSVLQLFPSHRYADKLAEEDIGVKLERKDVIGKQWQTLGSFIIYHPYLVLVTCSAILFLGFAGLPRLVPSVKLMKFFKEDTTIIRDYTWLEQNLGQLVPMEVLIEFDNEVNQESFVDRMRLIQKVADASRELKEVGGVLSIATIAPKLDAIEDKGTAARTIMQQLTKNYGSMSEFVTQDIAAAGKKFQARAKENGTYESPKLEDMGLEGDLVKHLHSCGINNLETLDAKLPRAIEEGKVSKEQEQTIYDVVHKWQIDHGNELFRVTSRVEALSDVDYGDFVEDLRRSIDPVIEEHIKQPGCAGVKAIYTGSVPLVYKTQHELMHSLYWSILMAFVTISIVMMIMLRNFVGGLFSMIPNIFPIAVVFGAMGWLGIKCDLGAMMTASVALGIATDDTIHYLTWYRRALDEGLHHHKAALSAYRRCATAMTQTTFISALGLSVFSFSTFTPTLAFGLMMLVLMFMALFGDMIFLPAILIASGGRVFSKGQTVTQD
ncbi:MAG: MMPL family transporter [Planctomycetia bacterium]|nr:MMPL family transporter [Planctomycetia bacterium]